MSNGVIPWRPAPLPSLYGPNASVRLEPFDESRREIKGGLAVVLIFVLGFIVWAAIARLDAAAYAQGKLVVAGQRQTVQHRDGGVIRSIEVVEGQEVRRGDILVTLAEADVLAQERAATAQAIALLAQRARLQAEQTGQAVVAFPAELRDMGEDDREAAAAAIRLQQRQLDARRALLATQQAVISQRSHQAVQESRGYFSQSAAAATQVRLIGEELEDLLPLQERGFVAGNRIKALQRAKAALEGERARYGAAAASADEASTEARLAMLGADREHLDGVAAELRQVEAELSVLLPRLRAARDRLSRTAIRAPATGTIVGLAVFTPGGVVGAGQRLMDIVPATASMVIEARIKPADADDLMLGQTVLVRFSTLHERTAPTLRGKLTRVSADSFIDERNGSTFYTAEVTVPDEELSSLKRNVRRELKLRAGTPVQLQIQLRKRTALQYALEPLTNSVWRSFGEQ